MEKFFVIEEKSFIGSATEVRNSFWLPGNIRNARISTIRMFKKLTFGDKMGS
jgi:hypothetical protein